MKISTLETLNSTLDKTKSLIEFYIDFEFHQYPTSHTNQQYHSRIHQIIYMQEFDDNIIKRLLLI